MIIIIVMYSELPHALIMFTCITDCEAFLFANQTNRFPVVSPYPGLTINEILAMTNRLPIPPEHRPDIVWGWDSDSDSD